MKKLPYPKFYTFKDIEKYLAHKGKTTFITEGHLNQWTFPEYTSFIKKVREWKDGDGKRVLKVFDFVYHIQCGKKFIPKFPWSITISLLDDPTKVLYRKIHLTKSAVLDDMKSHLYNSDFHNFIPNPDQPQEPWSTGVKNSSFTFHHIPKDLKKIEGMEYIELEVEYPVVNHTKETITIDDRGTHIILPRRKRERKYGTFQKFVEEPDDINYRHYLG